MNNNYNSNTVVKQDFAVVKQVDGQEAHMTGHNSAPAGLELLGGVGCNTPKEKSRKGSQLPHLRGPRWNAGIAERVKY